MNGVAKFFLLIGLIFGCPLWASEPLLFGPEFTFRMYPFTVNGQALIALQEQMKKHLVEGQPEGSEFTLGKVEHRAAFFSPNGWYVIPKTDPGVVEANVNPMTVADFTNFAPDIQDALFVSAANVGIYPGLYVGGGHISISAKYFADKPLLLRNFIVDFLNHSELALGIWSFDTNSALSPALYPPSAWIRIRHAVQKFDRSNRSLDKLVTLTHELYQVFSSIPNDPFHRFWHSGGPRGRRSAVNLSRIGGFEKPDSRIEIRSFRPQASMDVFVRQIRLLEKRIHYLEKLDEPIRLRPNFLKLTKDNASITKKNALVPPINPQQALSQYYVYVTQSGESWADHQDYIWPQWITEGELEKFNRSISCVHLLGGAF